VRPLPLLRPSMSHLSLSVSGSDDRYALTEHATSGYYDMFEDRKAFYEVRTLLSFLPLTLLLSPTGSSSVCPSCTWITSGSPEILSVLTLGS
jgi:hypothetical protein